MCELSVLDDDIDQWRRRLHACILATGGHFEYSSRQKLAKTLLTVINVVKIYCLTRHFSDCR